MTSYNNAYKELQTPKSNKKAEGWVQLKQSVLNNSKIIKVVQKQDKFDHGYTKLKPFYRKSLAGLEILVRSFSPLYIRTKGCPN